MKMTQLICPTKTNAIITDNDYSYLAKALAAIIEALILHALKAIICFIAFLK